jgi:hypothetical protein
MRAVLRALSLFLLSLVGGLFLAGCGPGERAESGDAPSGPTLVVIDSVRLAEADTVYIGRPGKPHVDPYDGSFYVPDLFSNQVYRFARDGRLTSVYGRPGQGPGEFGSVGAAVVIDDTTLMVIDRGNSKLAFFDRSTGRLLRERPLVGTPAQAAPLVIGDSVWMHIRTVGARRDLVRFSLTADSTERVGRRPGAFLSSIEAGGRYALLYGSGGFLAPTAGWILHGYVPLNWVYVHDHDGSVLDSAYVPSVRRRGVPADLQARLDVDKINVLDAMELHSALFDVHVLPDGQVAFVHQDWTLLSRETIPPPSSATVWVSLLSSDLERACVDTQLSDSKDAKPMEAFRGDTIFQLERRIVDDEGAAVEAETWLRIVRIDPAGCDWIPARPPEEEGSGR